MSRLIPFALLPASWGLKGRPYEEAKAYYELEGEALLHRLNEIKNADNLAQREDDALLIDFNFGHLTEFEYGSATIANDLKRGKIDQLEHDIEMIVLAADRNGIDLYARDRLIAQRRFPDAGVEHSVALLEIDLKHDKINQQKFDKEKATLLEAPWVDVIDSGFDPKDGVNGFSLTLDWNSYWVEYLRMHGYTGVSESDIVEKWFADVCRSKEPVADAPFEGLIPFRGPFSSDNGTFVV